MRIISVWSVQLQNKGGAHVTIELYGQKVRTCRLRLEVIANELLQNRVVVA